MALESRRKKVRCAKIAIIGYSLVFPRVINAGNYKVLFYFEMSYFIFMGE